MSKPALADITKETQSAIREIKATCPAPPQSLLHTIKARLSDIAMNMRQGHTVMAYEQVRQLEEFVQFESKK